jgi:calcineurin-like phosphoesterase family protein
MPSVWLTSDTHFGHLGVCKFLRNDGVTKLRPWDNPEEMDEEMVKRWNDTVRPGDKVYHLGDVVINRKALPILNRLNGDKVLIRGNHDIFKLEDYTKYFRDVRAYHILGGQKIIMSHIPLHSDSLYRWKCNIHGHTHSNRVMKDVSHYDDPEDKLVLDTKYFCVCVEQTDFKPILMEEVLAKIEKQQNEKG